MFSLVCRHKENICFRCGTIIETEAEFSIEHKSAWQSAPDPLSAFFDLNNISFSHLVCNIAAASKNNIKIYGDARERQRAYYERSKLNGRNEAKNECRRRWRRRKREERKNMESIDG